MKRWRYAALAALSCAACGGSGPPEVLAVLPEFAMTAVGEKTESPFGRKELLGRVWVADFIFTSCGGPCPLLTDRLAKLGATLPEEVGLLSVTVDPDTDTPERLRDYARSFGVDRRPRPGARRPRPGARQRWVWLRGSTADTYRLLYAGFRQPMSVDPKAPPEARVTHSTRFVLVDKQGAIRGFYDGLSDEENAALARDARRLLEMKS